MEKEGRNVAPRELTWDPVMYQDDVASFCHSVYWTGLGSTPISMLLGASLAAGAGATTSGAS